MKIGGENTDQKINSGEGSRNYQGKTININQSGMSYSEARSLFMDLFAENFTKMKAEAADLAFSRSKELVDEFMARIQKEDPEVLNQFSQPGMQNTFYNAQKEYAISGEPELMGILVEMLTERAKTPNKGVRQIVLDESVKLAGQLSVNQMDSITISFLLYYTSFSKRNDYQTFKSGYLAKMDSLLEGIQFTSDEFEFLEYLRLGKINLTQRNPFAATLLHTYPDYYNKGMTFDEIRSHLSDCQIKFQEDNDIFKILIKNRRNPGRYQYGSANTAGFASQLLSLGLSEQIGNWSLLGAMDRTEVESELVSEFPSFQKLFSAELTTTIKEFSLSPVGLTIAISNFQRKFGEKLDLGIWVK